MKIISLSDIHGSAGVFYLLEKAIEQERPDLICLAGDITNFGPAKFAVKLVSYLKDTTKVFAVPGNCDTKEVAEKLEELSVSLHKRRDTFMEFRFAGLGGSNETPHKTPFEMSEDTIYSSLKPHMSAGCILLTHSPPKGILDEASNGMHIGSRALQRIVENYQPLLMICGHVHDSPGYILYGNTTVVNAGPAKEGRYAVIKVEKSKVIDVELKQI